MRYDAVVIGGGFYGSCLAVFLRKYFAKVALFEREDTLLMHASRVNQARLHNGYHYPRSFLTAARSHANMDVFRRHFPDAVEAGFRHLYCIARDDSKVGRRHFERLARTIGIPLRQPPENLTRLFNERLIEAVYEVEEPAFNVDALRVTISRQLVESGVDVRIGTAVHRVDPLATGEPLLELEDGGTATAGWVFNCTYAALNQVVAADPVMHSRLALQMTEMALVEPPEMLRDLGVTVMDGAFFSIMPFPSEKLHSLSHVRYTPHLKWIYAEKPDLDPIRLVENWHEQSHFSWMVRDAQRYMPAISGVRYVKSLYVVKALVAGTQVDDARPVLFHRDTRNDHVISILGSKIDNIFDVYDFVKEALDLP
jgi:glycine/D-amino acid oxidase-like deaminating enzyme